MMTKNTFIIKYINRGTKPSRGANYNTGNKWYFRKIFVELWLRKKLWCGYCGVKFDLRNPKNRPTLDHIIPQAENGSHNIKNLTPCCIKCNKKKGVQKWEVRYPVEKFGILGMKKN